MDQNFREEMYICDVCRCERTRLSRGFKDKGRRYLAFVENKMHESSRLRDLFIYLFILKKKQKTTTAIIYKIPGA